MNRCVTALLLGVGLLIGGCSAGFEFAYARLDRLALWQIDDYLPLDAAQTAAFRREFAALKAWHWRVQRPGQIAALRELADRIERGEPAGAAVLAILDRIDTDALALWQQARPGIERLLGSLVDDQIVAYDRRVRDRIDERHAERAKATVAQRRERWFDDWQDRLRRWIGKPNAEQRRLLDAAWAIEEPLRPGPDADRAAARERHQQFLSLLAGRRQPGLGLRLEAEAQARDRSRDAAERQRQRETLSALFDAADADQRRHFVTTLRRLADRLDALTEPAASSASTGA